MTRILIIRTDAIGDAILWSGALERLRSLFSGAHIGVLCRPSVAPLYENCPFIDDILPIAYDDARFSADDRAAAIRIANAWRPTLLLNPIRSMHPHAESIVAEINAPKKICIEPDTANAVERDITRFLAQYDQIIPGAASPAHIVTPELHHHAAFLRGLGEPSNLPITPRLFLSSSDEDAAARILQTHGLAPDTTITVFPTGRWQYKHYPRWSEALRAGIKPDGPVRSLLLMGGADAAHSAGSIAKMLDPTPLRIVDLTGRTPLRTTLALIAHTRACVGTDTFATHAACAAGVPNAVVLGGGHPGRFLPYSPLTHAAMLPLDCTGCDWRCRFARAHCVTDIPPETVAQAIDAAVHRLPAGAPIISKTDLPPFQHNFDAIGPTASSSIPLRRETPRGDLTAKAED